MSAPQKQVPILSIAASPLTPQVAYRGRACGIADYLPNLDKRPGTAPGYVYPTAASRGYQPLSGPGQGGDIQAVNNLTLYRLEDNVDKTNLIGYGVSKQIVPLNNVLDQEAKINPPGDITGLIWTPTDCSYDDTKNQCGNGYWQTCLPDRVPLACALRYSNVDMLTLASAQTALPLPQNQHFRVELQLIGAAKTGQSDYAPFLQLAWGQQFALSLWAGNDAALSQGIPSGGNGAAQDNYQQLRNLPHLNGFWDYAPVTFDVCYYGGRLVVENDQNTTVYTDRSRNTSPQMYNTQEGKVNAVTGYEGPLAVTGRGTAFTLRVHEIAYGDEGDGTAGPATNQGDFTRQFYSSFRLNPLAITAAAVGYDETLPSAAQRQPLNSGVNIAITAGKDLTNNYKCTIKSHAPTVATVPVAWRPDGDISQYGSGYAMRGHSTPIYHSVTLSQAPTWQAVTTADPLEMFPAMISLEETCSDPALQAGLTWSGEFNRLILKDLPSPTGVGTVGENWQQYCSANHQCRIMTAWQYDDGHTHAYTAAGTDVGAVTRFLGYITSIGPSAPGVNERPMKVRFQDPMYRLMPPAAMIDDQYAALDFLYYQKQMDPSAADGFWGADGAQYILQTALGSQWANALQVQYPGFAMQAWNNACDPRIPSAGSAGQPTLMEYALFADPPSGGGLFWPPPFRQAAADWLHSLAATEFCTFFFAPSVSDPTQIAPTYANYWEYIQGWPTMHIPTADYVDGDVNLLMRSGEWEQLEQEFYNEVQVWGNAPGQAELGGLIPALPQFSAKVPVYNTIPELSEVYTWKRTKLLYGPQYYLPMVAQNVANFIARLLANVQVRRVKINCRGIECLWWGQKCQLVSTSGETDPQLVFNAPGTSSPQTFRIMRVSNHYTQSDWKTDLSIADLPSS